jgi:hypothetical protein
MSKWFFKWQEKQNVTVKKLTVIFNNNIVTDKFPFNFIIPTLYRWLQRTIFSIFF